MVRYLGSCCAGADGIHIKQVLDRLGEILPRLVDLFNQIVTTCTYLESWKRSVIKPIPKCLNLSKSADYCPIAIQPIFDKIFDGVMLEQITEYLERVNFFEARQFGFRRGLCCEHAVLDLVEGILSDILKGRVFMVVFEDFSVAFNCLYCSSIISAALWFF